jgi:TonB family protein
MFFLLLKVTILLLAGLVALLATRNSTAANRHLLCVCALAGSILLPLGALVRVRPISFRTQALDAAVRHSPVMTQAAALPWRSIVLAVWAFGTMLLILRLGIGYWRISRLMRAATPLDPRLFAAGVNVPLASGLFRPVILLPSEATAWPEWQRTAAIRHELAHIERKDLWANFLANLACALYWFHPLVWTMSGHLRREQEAACDDTVVHAGFDRTVYAEALLAVAKNSPSTLIPGCYMTTTSDVKSRIFRLLGSPRSHRPTFARTAVAFAVIVLAFAALTPLQAQKVYKVGGDVTTPRILDKVDPQYTDEARSAKIQGTVTLSMVVGADGMAHDISVQKSLEPGLDRKAAEAIEQWHFAPATLNGEPVMVQVVIEVNFKLL